MVYALHEALRVVLEEGLERRWSRHQANHAALRAGLEAIGLRYATSAQFILPQLNAVFIPAGVDDGAVRKQLLEEFGIEIGGGLGEFKGKAWRIGLMGYNATPNSVYQLLAGLEQCLLAQNLAINPGAGVGAAERAYLPVSTKGKAHD
jgi:alanine-glyoxylate transaminase/serine-glyoxylate transaminase/serine-pyruvate transaminase